MESPSPSRFCTFPGLEIMARESPDTMTGQIHFRSVTCSFWPVKFITYRKILKISPRGYIFQRPFLRGLFLEGLMNENWCYKFAKSRCLELITFLKNSLSTIKIYYSGEMNISLCAVCKINP